ncbi:hypothetical protein ACFFX0_27330 [Citricoccus parietis]|uniref:Uncharacterized protein n=1 Tax=Citricoccus parietis TaxID=592307 RepID=A0ABV5G6W5_9MICC
MCLFSHGRRHFSGEASEAAALAWRGPCGVFRRRPPGELPWHPPRPPRRPPPRPA